MGNEHPYTEILLTPHGFIANVEDGDTLEVQNDFAQLTHAEDRVTSHSATNTCRMFNYDGRPVPPTETSPYLLRMWDQKKKRTDITGSIKKGLARLFAKRQHKALADAENDANEMISAFYDKVQLKHDSAGSKWTAQEQAEMKKITAQGYRMKQDATLKDTPHNVFIEIRRLVLQHQANTPETWKPQAVIDEEERVAAIGGPQRTEEDIQDILGQRIMVRQLVQYLREVTMPGFESPISKAMTDCSLRDMHFEMYPGIGNIVDDTQFRKWYTLDDDQKALEGLNDKTVFALLLEEKIELSKPSRQGGQGDTVEHQTNHIKKDEVHKLSPAAKAKKGGITRRMSKMWNTLSDSRVEEGDGDSGAAWSHGVAEKGSNQEFDGAEFMTEDQIISKKPAMKTRNSVLRRMSHMLFPTKSKAQREGEDDHYEDVNRYDDEAKDSAGSDRDTEIKTDAKSTSAGSSVDTEKIDEMASGKRDLRDIEMTFRYVLCIIIMSLLSFILKREKVLMQGRDE